MSAAQGSTTISMKGEQLSIDLEDLYDILNLEEQNFGTPHEQKTEVVVPVGPELTEASIFSKLEIPMVQLLNAPPKFMVPPSASCPPSIAGSPPTGSTSLFASFQLPSPPATTSPSLSTSCGSSPPKSVSPGYQATPTPKQFSQPSSPRHRSPRTSISDAGAPDTKLQKIPRHKRPSHRKAEIKRRVKIQNGFDAIKELVPAIGDTQSNGKDSKSSMLVKTAEYCRQLHGECKHLQKESEKLKLEMAQLSAEIEEYQSFLPSNGVELLKPQQGPDNLSRMCEEYIRSRTLCNWKFWIFSIVMGTRPMFESFKSVRTDDKEDFQRSVVAWVQEQCPLTTLRRVVSEGLRDLSKKSSVMNAPERLPSEAQQAAVASLLKPEEPSLMQVDVL